MTTPLPTRLPLPERLAAALATLGDTPAKLAALHTAERSAWQRATLASQERMTAMFAGRCALADLIECGVTPAVALKVADKQGLLPIAEILHFTRASAEDRLDVARFCKYLRQPSHVSSTPSTVMATPLPQPAEPQDTEPQSSEATSPDAEPPAAEPPVPVRFRSPIPDQTTVVKPSYLTETR